MSERKGGTEVPSGLKPAPHWEFILRWPSARLGVLLFLAMAALFLVMNRAAYHGYFQEDEFDNLGWTHWGPLSEYLKGVITPRFFVNNFRPVGHFYFYIAANRFGLDFAKYVAVIHVFHLLNVWLVWLLARRLGAPPLAAAAGCAFFAFHMALFDDLWKPAYVFDVLCATFCLLSLLLYDRGRWVLSFVCFWLAYKSKELAVMLPFVLACYEWWFGKRRWKPLIPFFLASLSFGLQGVLLNPNKNNDYAFRFTPRALITTSLYYAGRIFLVPYLGFLAPLAALLVKDRRVWFGLAAAALLPLPLLFLPEHLFSAYCYAPFAMLAVALAGVAERVRPVWLAVFFVLWIPLDFRELRALRNIDLAKSSEIRQWTAGVEQFAAGKPKVDTFAVRGAPGNLPGWGMEGALKFIFRRIDIQIHSADEPGLTGRVAVLIWDPVNRRLTVREPKD